MYLSPGESPRTITTSCLWALLWLRCTHLPGQHTGSDWHINSSSAPLSSCCVQNECHITASERLCRLISNGSSASGILPADVLGAMPCEASGAPATRKQARSRDFNLTMNTTAILTSVFLSSTCLHCFSVCFFSLLPAPCLSLPASIYLFTFGAILEKENAMESYIFM